MPDFATLTSHVREIFVALFPTIQSADWTGADWTDEQKLGLNKFMHLLNDVYNDKLRRAYDRTIWDGHKTGKVAKKPAVNGLEPVRAETVRKDSAKSEPVTADNIFDALLGVEATVETTPEDVTTE